MPDGSPERSARVESGEIATSTLAEIYAQQGLLGRALSIYRRMLTRTPDDTEIAGRIESLERRIAEAGPEPAVERANVPEAPARERLPWDPPEPAAAEPPPESAPVDTPSPEPAAVPPAEPAREPVAEPQAEPARRVGPIDARAFEAWLERR